MLDESSRRTSFDANSVNEASSSPDPHQIPSSTHLLPKMVRYLDEPQSVISIAMKVALGAKIKETTQMEESLRADSEALAVKVKEHSMLKTEKQDMLAEEAPKAKFADGFMVFLDAIENEDLETVQSFDEKAMMDTISTMMNNNGGDIGGLVAGFYGDYLNMIGVGLEEKVSKDTIVATSKTDDSCGGDDNGGFAGGYGDDVPNIKLGLEEGATVVASEGPNSDGNGA